MTRTFIQTNEFSNNWDRLGFDDEDLRWLENEIMKDPKKYPVIKGTGSLRKARIAMNNRGKSKSARVCYVDFLIAETVYLITVYGKNEKDNLSMQERHEIKRMIEALERNLGGKQDE
ncbi:MAG: addiction module toxin RelE [Butyrivibrio sp.]|nr:addiction module toxin RelE [Butyrivibrio sp.]